MSSPETIIDLKRSNRKMVKESKRSLLHSLKITAKKDMKDALAWAKTYEAGRFQQTGCKITQYMVAGLVYLFQTANGRSNLIGKLLCEEIGEYNMEEEIYLLSSFRFPVICIYNVIKQWKDTNDIPPVFNVQLICEEYDIMHVAAARDDLDIMPWLLRYNIVDIKDCAGKTPLHIAAAGGRMRTTRYLLSSGASLYSLDNTNRTPLQVALENFKFNVADYLKPEVLCNLRLNDGETILMRFVRDGLEPQVKYLLRFAEYFVLNNSDQNILHVCAESGQALVMKRILRDFNLPSSLINAYDAFHRTPLSIAVLENRASVVKLLLSAGAYITSDITNRPVTQEIANLLQKYSFNSRDSKSPLF